ncbi:hypothetical protein LTR46_011951 [Exophiala xenobiotica]|nr:hypothetical protein LTR46_011951 [Exophiala xenobiotica]
MKNGPADKSVVSGDGLEEYPQRQTNRGVAHVAREPNWAQRPRPQDSPKRTSVADFQASAQQPFVHLPVHLLELSENSTQSRQSNPSPFSANMTQPEEKRLPNGMRDPIRYVTDYDKEGKSVFHEATAWPIPYLDRGMLRAGVAYAYSGIERGYPFELGNQADISDYKRLIEDQPGIKLPGGFVYRIIDIGPGQDAPMHRTLSLDLGVMIEGEMDCILDSGEVRTFKPGDLFIQRATYHAWRNNGPAWVRFAAVILDAAPFQGGSDSVTEDYGKATGYKRSDE